MSTRARRPTAAEREAARLAANGEAERLLALRELMDGLSLDPETDTTLDAWRAMLDTAADRLRAAQDAPARRRAVADAAVLRASLAPRVMDALERERARHNSTMRSLLSEALRLNVERDRRGAAARSGRARHAGKVSAEARTILNVDEVRAFVERKVAAGTTPADARSAAREHFTKRDPNPVSARTVNRKLRNIGT